ERFGAGRSAVTCLFGPVRRRLGGFRPVGGGFELGGAGEQLRVEGRSGFVEGGGRLRGEVGAHRGGGITLFERTDPCAECPDVLLLPRRRARHGLRARTHAGDGVVGGVTVEHGRPSFAQRSLFAVEFASGVGELVALGRRAGRL